MSRPVTNLSAFDNAWYDPGRSLGVRLAWMALNRVFLQTWMPWPSTVKAGLLRWFGARIGKGVVLKNHISVKYPWNLTIGNDSWIGEGAWIDSLANVTIGSNACLSQGCMIETGNHDWSKPAFDLIVREVVVEDGAWAAVKSVLLPGSRLASHAILGAGSVLSGDTEPYGIYVGVPARKVKERNIDAAG
ncbi:WcaF family extracellular polysaccharide biosynthesis acetyltransferase [Anaeromyxobacter terrae]|uniref:WcaF family extracellular polysaccharide biosynthesis acetyltransferase n=1 Tax=Anaeromyxobacter terrae TaxID=2925406 RepID=UPI001F574E5B|nr:WcaF family extracellular polysaccharide biosynthesis acetyltransferase [Anaeromyxobacter sp. SG22]